jgi:hypothetical protein
LSRGARPPLISALKQPIKPEDARASQGFLLMMARFRLIVPMEDFSK